MLGRLDRGVVRELIDKIGTAIFVVDVLEDGGFRLAAINRRVEEITGLHNEEVAGKEPEEVFDAPGAARARKYWQRCVEARHTIEFENWQDFAAGRVWAVTTLVPVLEQERVLRLIGTAIEITARKQREQVLRETAERFRRLAEDGADLLWETDAERTWSYCGPQATHFFGRPPEEVVGRPVLRFQSEEESKRMAPFVEFVRSNRVPFFGVEHKLQRPDGSTLDVESSGIPVFDEDGTYRGYRGMTRDISERKRTEAALRESREQLRHAQKMEVVGTLATGVAHDFNNLLTAIFGYSEMARAHIPEHSEALEALDGLEEAARQASQVTQSLLTLSRRTHAPRAPIDLTRLVHESVNLLQRVIPASIEIEPRLDPDIWVEGAASQLQQVILNLALNARDAMPDGGRLGISVGRAEGFGSLVVDDAGTGMTEDVRERLFDPFFTTKPRERGTGLGMAIVHGIVEDHGGRIRVESEEGRGTRITVLLPLCEASPTEAAGGRGEPAVRGQGELVLVAEDQRQLRAIMASTLRSAGYRVLQAADGEQALELFQAHRDEARLLVLDIDMPKLDGLSFLEEVTKQRPGLPAVVISGLADPPRVEQSCVRFLAKPFPMAELARVAGEALAGTSGEDATRAEDQDPPG
ncbi:MAG: PAS domain S-box protein [Planctomycetota bacterium]|nr:PAS domain S-box protein [Planctomycetota bacterium]